MVAGLIRLGAYGREDLYLSYRPQITFFKTVYKRYTFFAIETVDQGFTSTPTFGGKFSCIISPHGDVLLDLFLKINLPPIPPLPGLLKTRWVDTVACALVKKVEFEVNGIIVDTITGEWIKIWLELNGYRKDFCRRSGSHKRGLTKMMGEFSSFQSSQEGTLLYLPLPFWFTKSPGQCFPIAAINTREVRVNVEFNKLTSILQYGPTHSISVQENQVFFKEGDLLYQSSENAADGKDAKAFGLYLGFDSITKTVFFNPLFGSFNPISDVSIIDRFLSPNVFFIRNQQGYFCTPLSNAVSIIDANIDWFLQQRFSLGNTVVAAQYSFLSQTEKKYFDNRRHEYVIEQLQVYSLSDMSKKSTIQLTLRRPCSEIVWVAQLATSSHKFGVPFNFTDRPDGNGESIITKNELSLNTDIVYEDTDGLFYKTLQPFGSHLPTKDRLKGIQLYSFSLMPDNPQPSGSINMSRIEKAYLTVQTSPFPNDSISMRIYARTYNVLIIQEGIAELLF